MTLVLNEEQRLLRDTAKEFLAEHAPVTAFRALRDGRDERAYSVDLWRQMVEMGWAGITIPEQYGGLEFGFMGLGAVIEQTGHTLAASPLFASVVLGASLLELGGSESQKKDLLPAVAAGELTLALALEESHHHAPCAIGTTATAVAGNWELNGDKVFVADGHSADKLVVVARTAGAPGDTAGLSLLLVERDAPGVSVTRTRLADSRNWASIRFDRVPVPAGNLLGTEGKGWDILEPALDRGRICLAAELLGISRECFARTLAYLKEREQFGVKIGSFQALKHRAARMYAELELAQSTVLDALSALDENRADVPQLASMAKACLNDVSYLVTNEAVQMHGGIGVTDALDIGLFLKRTRTCTAFLGSSSYHEDRYARLGGY